MFHGRLNWRLSDLFECAACSFRTALQKPFSRPWSPRKTSSTDWKPIRPIESCSLSYRVSRRFTGGFLRVVVWSDWFHSPFAGKLFSRRELFLRVLLEGTFPKLWRLTGKFMVSRFEEFSLWSRDQRCVICGELKVAGFVWKFVASVRERNFLEFLEVDRFQSRSKFERGTRGIDGVRDLGHFSPQKVQRFLLKFFKTDTIAKAE